MATLREKCRIALREFAKAVETLDENEHTQSATDAHYNMAMRFGGMENFERAAIIVALLDRIQALEAKVASLEDLAKGPR